MLVAFFFTQVKLFTDTLVRTMVEPRRRCYSLPAVDLRKKAVGCVIYVTVILASKLSRSSFKGSPPRKQQNYTVDGTLEEHFDDKYLETFVEVELGELTRRTDARVGSSPRWDSLFNMVLHEDTGTLRFHLYESTPSNVKYDYLASCEIKVLQFFMLISAPNYTNMDYGLHVCRPCAQTQAGESFFSV